MMPQSSQDRSAQTRIQNDQQRAQTSQIASRSVRDSLNKPVNAPSGSRPQQQQQQAPQQQQMQQAPRATGGPNYMGPGPQPVGELGDFIKQMNAQNQNSGPPELMAGGGQPMDMDKQNVDVEEFLQSPALQEAIARTKLTQYFSGRGKTNSPEYASSVLANMSRY